MKSKIDIYENEIRDRYPMVLETLLRDQSTGNNILWLTNNYQYKGNKYDYHAEILPELITGKHGNVIKPRVQKDKEMQQTRVRDMAEVFTPSWICNAQNNLIDNAWFGYENVFNTEITEPNGTHSWKTNNDIISFPEGKTWKDYVCDTRLEMTCGEAPYITSRYDTTTGEYIPVDNRIGLLDRKLRIINQNVKQSGEWLQAAQLAYQNTYAFEWQGDSLLLAREAMLYTFIDNYELKFKKHPLLKSIKRIADIISWNVWQMDGLKGVVPNSCGVKKDNQLQLFGEQEEKPCEGCKTDNIHKHNGIYCRIKDWRKTDPETWKNGSIMRFVDLIKKT